MTKYYSWIWEVPGVRLKPDAKSYFEKEVWDKSNTKTAYMLERERIMRLSVNALDLNDMEPEDFEELIDKYSRIS